MNKVYVFAFIIYLYLLISFLSGFRGDGRIYGIEGYNEFTNEWNTFPMLVHYPIEAEVLIKLSYHEIILFGGKDDVSESDKVTYYDLERKIWKDC